MTTSIVSEVEGEAGFDWVGFSLGFAGDVNGDGEQDWMASSLSATPGGHVAVFFGPAGGIFRLSEADLLLTGEFTFHNAGQSVSEAGGCDFDGDGTTDLLVGSPYADRFDIQVQSMVSGDNNGRAYVVFGSADVQQKWAPSKGATLAQADVTFVGASKYDAAGSSVACLGDVDGDGFDDIAVGAPRALLDGERVGAAYLLYGRPRGDLSAVINLEDSDAVLHGNSSHDGAGTSAARLGDVNGDGFADFAIGAPGVDNGGADAGGVYLVHGTGSRFIGQLNVAEAGALLFATGPGLRAGINVTTAGDFDADGLPDILIGTSTVGPAADQPGRAFLVHATSLADVAVGDSLSASDIGVTLAGEIAGDFAGSGVAHAGDLDGDGHGDILIGAPGGAGTVGAAGRLYLVAGRAAAPGATLELADEQTFARGTIAEEHFGEVVSGGVDVDSDGAPDVLVSARARSNRAQADGSFFVLSGVK